MPNQKPKVGEEPIKVGARSTDSDADPSRAIECARGELVAPATLEALPKQEPSRTAILRDSWNGDDAEAIAERLSHVFRRVSENPTAVELLRQVLAYRTKVSP
jgi:hypothetical protein